MRRILRFDVPVDGEIHGVVCGPVAHVDCRADHTVTVWAFDGGHGGHAFRVFATGEPIPDLDAGTWVHVGTALSPAHPQGPRRTRDSSRGEFVWHLFEKK